MSREANTGDEKQCRDLKMAKADDMHDPGRGEGQDEITH